MAGFEKLIADLDIIASLQVEFGEFVVDDSTLALDTIREVGHAGHFFGAEHTLARFRTCFHRPVIATKQNIERWACRRLVDGRAALRGRLACPSRGACAATNRCRRAARG